MKKQEAARAWGCLEHARNRSTGSFFLSIPRVLYLGDSSSWDGGLLENVAQDQWGHHIAESMLFCVKEK